MENKTYAILITMPGVQRSLYLNEMTNDIASMKAEVHDGVDGQTRVMLERCVTTCGRAAGTRAKMRSRARKEASAQEVRGYYNQFASAKHLGYRSWVDNKVFDLIDVQKVKPRNYVTGRWVLSIKTDKPGNFLRAKARWVSTGFQDKQKEYLQTDSPASTRPGFRMSCQAAASKGWDLFHIDLKTAFLQGQSYDVNRDVVCQLPPEAGHPPYIAARLKKPAYGMNDAPRRWWNILDKALCSYGTVPMRADRCCYVLYSTQSANLGPKKFTHGGKVQSVSKINRVCGQKQMIYKIVCWIPLQAVQPQETPWQELLIYSWIISLEQVERKWNNMS